MSAEPLPLHLYTMAVNSAWANERLLDALGRLRPETFARAVPSFFGSIAATANHLLTVDWLYVDALERALEDRAPHERPAVFFEPEVPFPAVAPLAEAQRAVDQRLLSLTQRLSSADLERVVRIRRRHRESRDSVLRILAHLFQHQIHHRGQIHALLSVVGEAPPQLDELFCAGDAANRAPELARLGITEDELWGAP